MGIITDYHAALNLLKELKRAHMILYHYGMKVDYCTSCGAMHGEGDLPLTHKEGCLWMKIDE